VRRCCSGGYGSDPRPRAEYLTSAETPTAPSAMTTSMVSSHPWNRAESSMASVAYVGHRDDPRDAHQQHPAAGGVRPIELFGPWNRKTRTTARLLGEAAH